MLPVPNLDDRSFEQLLQEAKSYIPQLAPDWTDENAHDPGITLLELLAWHIEMQQYRINRMSVEFDRKFLLLLGGWPRDRKPAMTSVSFTKVDQVTYLPYGSGLQVGQLHFETVRSMTIIPERTTMITLNHDGLTKELSHNVTLGRTAFYPFGEIGEIGSEMIIKLDQPLPRCMPLSLWIELDRQEAAVRIPARYKQFIPSARVQWSYLEQNEEGEAWLPVRMERDESYSFHQSGPILFELPLATSEVTMLKAEIVEGQFDDLPRVKRMLWNEVFASQGQTWCIQELFDGWPEQDAEMGKRESIQLYLYHALYQFGDIQVQYRYKDGWKDVDSSSYMIEQEQTFCTMTIQPIDIIPIGEACIRVIAVHPDFVEQQYIAQSTGISNQRYPLPNASLYEEQLKLQVLSVNQAGEKLWHDWERVLDFDHSNSESRHYVIDEQAHILFSNGIYGISPSYSEEPNIRIIQFRTGEGAAGNVKEDTIKQLAFSSATFEVTNLFPAYGGEDKESISEALARVKLEVLSPKSGVTEQDLERLVHEIPGVRVARCKAIGGYYPQLSDYPNERALGHTSIVVVPQSSKSFPKPSKGLCQTISQHLEPYRLLTTKLHIIEPEYVKITIRAVIVVHPHYEGREQLVVAALNSWLSPEQSSSFTGWDFGKAINKSDVYDYIHTVAGVHYIQDLWIMAEGNNVVKDEGGDIRIPPNGLAFSGEHEIEFIINEGG